MAYEVGKKSKNDFKAATSEIESCLAIDHDITESALNTATLAAEEANATMIPAYGVDGATKIGVFESF